MEVTDGLCAFGGDYPGAAGLTPSLCASQLHLHQQKKLCVEAWKHVSISGQQKRGHSHSITEKGDGSRRPPVVSPSNDISKNLDQLSLYSAQSRTLGH